MRSCAICRGVWHTPCKPPPEPHRKPPPRHRNLHNSGRMQYAPTAVEFIVRLVAAYLCGVLHTPCTPPHEPYRKPPPRHRKLAQFRAYAIRPYKRCNSLADWALGICAAYGTYTIRSPIALCTFVIINSHLNFAKTNGTPNVISVKSALNLWAFTFSPTCIPTRRGKAYRTPMRS